MSGPISDLAERVSEIPRRFEQGDCSTAALLEETGFLEAPERLTVQDMEQALEHDPKLADDWMERGRDQRLTGGWGIEREQGKYCVRSFAGGGAWLEEDRLHATAQFAVRYLRFMGEVMRRHQDGGPEGYRR